MSEQGHKIFRRTKKQNVWMKKQKKCLDELRHKMLDEQKQKMLDEQKHKMQINKNKKNHWKKNIKFGKIKTCLNEQKIFR